MKLSREAIQRMVGGVGMGTSTGGGGGEGMSGGATQAWVNTNFVSIEFFGRLFKAYGPGENQGDPDVEVLPNDMDSTISNIEAMFGFWTDFYLTALGNGGEIGASIYLAGLADVNVAGVQSGQVLTWNAATNKWIATTPETGVDMSQVDFTIAETDQFWARDCGPMFVADSEGLPAIIDWGYNGYGRMDKFGPDVPEDLLWEMPEFVREEYMGNYVKDDVLSSTIAMAMNVKSVDVNGFILEGGAIETDGRGTIITTESCILNENRNPGMTRHEAELYFKKYMGMTNVIWLKGSPDEDITDGHIDGLMRFADANTIVTMTEEDYYETYDYTPKGDYRKVINAKNADGERYNIVTLPITEDIVEWLGWRANYLNYYAGNKVVLVPVYEDVMDAEALRILGQIYPDKEIIPINGSTPRLLILIRGYTNNIQPFQMIFLIYTLNIGNLL